ncbi:hypothetical protein [Thermaerobacillus caldiproteolyticus]|uniref:Uncharacterized protein n=1 Tax=Thermaerobacillus caldiproteolyticus TaxID=247480 RepID=A0A7V9Z3S8_9BACL|nr:hypothetical protein [Anoxybacillus caldiproteolyticus]MBA2873405.1 hypothetical protein [Anoxybacillus caldiproteolyticus]
MNETIARPQPNNKKSLLEMTNYEMFNCDSCGKFSLALSTNLLHYMVGKGDYRKSEILLRCIFTYCRM